VARKLLLPTVTVEGRALDGCCTLTSAAATNHDSRGSPYLGLRWGGCSPWYDCNAFYPVDLAPRCLCSKARLAVTPIGAHDANVAPYIIARPRIGRGSGCAGTIGYA
jgi:hypothetical protein